MTPAASRAARPGLRPSMSITRFSLPLVPEGPKGRPVIAMDYNLYARHSGAKEQLTDAKAFEDRAYDAFRAAFDAQYAGKRIPLELGFHFTLMNGGAYWNALERFAGEVCVKADVECISYRDYLVAQARYSTARSSGRLTAAAFPLPAVALLRPGRLR